MENQISTPKNESNLPKKVITSIGYTYLRLPQKAEEAAELRVVGALILQNKEESHG
jgi:hypothetical protein